ncbi:MAG: chalcone isomerase family protein [Desulfocapsaceae bacterium]|nr:chalcone isomerase family protein [Desulfocapsaceae bacterium]
MRIVCLVFLLVSLAVSASAREIADVKIPATVAAGDGVVLHLNGAGIRSKFFFQIYIAELYMEHPASNIASVIGDEGRKRIVMHFLYEELGKDKLTEAWDEGFRANTSPQQLALLQTRIAEFNAMFDSVKKGDQISLDYTPAKGTEVKIRNQVKGVVPGKDFNDALLGIWLGKEPVSPELRKELLDYTGAK